MKLPITGGEPVSLGEGAGAVWSPEGGRLAFTSRRTGSLRVWISGANGQRPQEVKDSPVGEPRPAWLPDGRLAWQTPDRHNYRIRDLLTGHDEFLLPEASATVASDAFFSPRGGEVALRRQQFPQVLSLISFSDRSERWLASEMRPIGWSADGEWIYALAFESRTFVRMSAQTQARERLGPFPEGRQIGTCDLTRDPRLIICSLSDETFDAWIMSDFDPNVP